MEIPRGHCSKRLAAVGVRIERQGSGVPFDRFETGGRDDGGVETTKTPNTGSVCGESFDSEDELRSQEAEQHSEMGPASGDTSDERRGSSGPGEGMGREQGGGVAGG